MNKTSFQKDISPEHGNSWKTVVSVFSNRFGNKKILTGKKKQFCLSMEILRSAQMIKVDNAFIISH